MFGFVDIGIDIVYLWIRASPGAAVHVGYIQFTTHIFGL